MHIHIFTNWAEVTALLPDWEELYSASGLSTVNSPAWLSAWWNAHGLRGNDPCGELRVIAFRAEKQLVALLPLYLQRRKPTGLRVLRFVGTGEALSPAFPEYLDVLCAAGHREQVLAALKPLLFSRNVPEFLRHDELDLGIGAADGTLVQWAEGLPVLERGILLTHHLRSHEAELSGGFEQYLSSIHRDMRSRARRILRDAERQNLQFNFYQNWQPTVFAEMVEMHQEHWNAIGKTGAFMSGAARNFQERAAEALLNQGRACLAEVRDGSKLVAALYGFFKGDCFEFYQSARAGNTRAPSPGVLAHLLLLRHLAGLGIRRYCFLAGSEDYKRQLSNRYHYLVQLRFLNPTPLWLAASLQRLISYV